MYLADTYCFAHAAKLLDLWEDGGKTCAALDGTVFHPQGGGQPSDVGELASDGLSPLRVSFVAMDKARQGVVRHEVEGELGAWRQALAASGGALPVSCKIDADKRVEHARLHSAGHLLDVAVHDLGFKWRAGKGYHFADGPYVEYVVTGEGRPLDAKDLKAKDAVIVELNNRLCELIAQASPVNVVEAEGVRTVELGGVSCGCGGTHVRHSGELGAVVVKKIAAKKENMRVSYTMSASS